MPDIQTLTSLTVIISPTKSVSGNNAAGYITFKKYEVSINADIGSIVGAKNIEAKLTFALSTEYAVKLKDLGKAAAISIIAGAFGTAFGGFASGTLGGGAILKPVVS